MKITFFPRNKVQKILFENVAAKLSFSGHDSYFLNPKTGQSKGREYYPEEAASNLIIDKNFKRKEEFTRICKTYRNINRIIQSDRELNYFPSYFRDRAVSPTEKIDLCCAFFLVFERYLDAVQPDVIISEMVLGLMDGALAEIAKKKGVVYLGIRPSKIGPGIVFCDNEFDQPIFLKDQLNKIKKLSERSIRDTADEIIAKNINEVVLPHYMIRSSRKFKIFSWRAFRSLYRLIFHSVEIPIVSIYQHKRLNAFREAFYKYRNIRGWIFKDKNWEDSDFKEKFFIYAAHFEPEASVHVRAFDFCDQLGLIKMLSRLLPPDAVLIVKEHRGNQGFRKPEFYEELSHLYNVIIANPDENLRILARKSKGVITLTGRIGLEALIDNIPVIAFGETFWTSLKNVYKPRSIDEIRSVLLKLANQTKKTQKNTSDKITKDVNHLIVAYQNLVFAGNFIQGSDEFLSENNVDAYSSAILKIIEERKFGVRDIAK